MERRQEQFLIAPVEFEFILAMNCRGRLRIARIALSTGRDWRNWRDAAARFSPRPTDSLGPSQSRREEWNGKEVLS